MSATSAVSSLPWRKPPTQRGAEPKVKAGAAVTAVVLNQWSGLWVPLVRSGMVEILGRPTGKPYTPREFGAVNWNDVRAVEFEAIPASGLSVYFDSLAIMQS